MNYRAHIRLCSRCGGATQFLPTKNHPKGTWVNAGTGINHTGIQCDLVRERGNCKRTREFLRSGVVTAGTNEHTSLAIAEANRRNGRPLPAADDPRWTQWTATVGHLGGVVMQRRTHAVH